MIAGVYCLECAAALRPGEAEWVCTGCTSRYPAVLGIPDFTGENYDACALALVDAYHSASYEDLLRLRTPQFAEVTDSALTERWTEYRQRAEARGRRFYEMILERIADCGGVIDRDRALMIGCGAGGSLVCAARTFRQVVGVDPDMADLILAKKAAEEASLNNVTLIRGYAQRMPFVDRGFDLILGENVLEHVHEIEPVIRECARVLGGWFIADSANRYNLLRPEPHVHLWGVGFLPRRWQAPYVRWRCGLRDYDKNVRLLSYGELRSAVRRHMRDGRVVFPGVSAYGLPRSVDRILRVIERVPPVAAVVLSIFPLHLAVGRH